jgi:hypothetical protein
VLSVVGQEGRSEFVIDLDELICEGARRMLAVALEEEVAAYIAAHAGEVDERGRRPGFYRVAHPTGTARPGRIRRALRNCVSIRFRFRPVADACGAPVLRDQGPIGRPGTARPILPQTIHARDRD